MTRLFQISLALAAIGFVLAAANPWSKLPSAVELVWTLGLLGLLVSGPVLLWRRFARRRVVR